MTCSRYRVRYARNYILDNIIIFSCRIKIPLTQNALYMRDRPICVPITLMDMGKSQFQTDFWTRSSGTQPNQSISWNTIRLKFIKICDYAWHRLFVKWLANLSIVPRQIYLLIKIKVIKWCFEQGLNRTRTNNVSITLQLHSIYMCQL